MFINTLKQEVVMSTMLTTYNSINTKNGTLPLNHEGIDFSIAQKTAVQKLRFNNIYYILTFNFLMYRIKKTKLINVNTLGSASMSEPPLTLPVIRPYHSPKPHDKQTVNAFIKTTPARTFPKGLF